MAISCQDRKLSYVYLLPTHWIFVWLFPIPVKKGVCLFPMCQKNKFTRRKWMYGYFLSTQNPQNCMAISYVAPKKCMAISYQGVWLFPYDYFRHPYLGVPHEKWSFYWSNLRWKNNFSCYTYNKAKLAKHAKKREKFWHIFAKSFMKILH